jgi:hypothetical protein
MAMRQAQETRDEGHTQGKEMLVVLADHVGPRRPT